MTNSNRNSNIEQRPFDIIVTQEFLDILKGSGNNMIPVDYKIGDKLRIYVLETRIPK